MAIQFKLSVGGSYAAGNFIITYEEMDGSTPIYMNDSAGGTSYTWSFVTKPKGSAAPLNNPGTSEANFIPDVEGSYIIKLDLDGIIEQKYAAVSTKKRAGRLPGREETEENATYGWAGALNDLLKDMDTRSFIPQYQYIHNADGSALAIGDIVSVSTTNFSYSDDLTVFLSDTTYATNSWKMRRPIGMAVEAIASDSPGRIITKGVYDGLNTGSYSAGDYLFVDMSSGSLTDTATDYPVGIVLESHSTEGRVMLDFGGLKINHAETFVPVEWAEDGAAPPAITEVLTETNGSVRIRRFDDSTDEDITFAWEMPTNMISDYGIRVEVICFFPEATTGTGKYVSYDVSEYHVGDFEDLGQSFGSSVASTSLVLTGLVQYDRVTCGEAALTGPGNNEGGNMLMINVSRNTAVANNYADDVGVYGIRIKYTTR